MKVFHVSPVASPLHFILVTQLVTSWEKVVSIELVDSPAYNWSDKTVQIAKADVGKQFLPCWPFSLVCSHEYSRCGVLLYYCSCLLNWKTMKLKELLYEQVLHFEGLSFAWSHVEFWECHERHKVILYMAPWQTVMMAADDGFVTVRGIQ